MKVLSRGLNFMGQLGIPNKNKNLSTFQEIAQLQNKNVKQIEAHFTQSYCRLDDGQILHWGYIFDSLTTTRVLGYYKKHPNFCKWWQDYAPVGKTLGLRLGSDKLGLLNGEQILKVTPKKISVGGSFLFYLSQEGIVYGIGENYKGQLGFGDTKYKFGFNAIQIPNNEKIVDVSAGFQHSIFITESGELYGCGRANWNQIVPIQNNNEKTNAFIDFYQNPMKMKIPNESVKQVATGFHHSIFLCQSGNLYGLGFNNKGQAGTSNLNKMDVEEFQRIYHNLEDNEHIVQIAAGKSHNVFFTNLGNVYMFGATNHYQLAREQDFDIDLCSPTQVYLPFKNGEIPVKIKANFDRSAVITNQGNCYVWGGENQKELSGENNYLVEDIRESLIQQSELIISEKEENSSNQQENTELQQQEYNQNTVIKDIGLGYMHTLILVDEQQIQQQINE